MQEDNHEIAVFGGGCFWCMEAVFLELEGVEKVMSGYAGGIVQNPTYEQVCEGDTGHAEVIKIEYNPKKILYEDLLAVFFATHDPTTLNRQGNDMGVQYRSTILYTSEDQREKAENMIRELGVSSVYKNPMVTEVKPLERFYKAEDYHKDYYRANPSAPYCQIVIAPKIEKFERRFKNLLKKKPE